MFKPFFHHLFKSWSFLLSLASPGKTIIASQLSNDSHLPVTGTLGKFQILGEIPSIFTVVTETEKGKTKKSLRRDVICTCTCTQFVWNTVAVCALCTWTALIRERCYWMSFLCQQDFYMSLRCSGLLYDDKKDHLSAPGGCRFCALKNSTLHEITEKKKSSFIFSATNIGIWPCAEGKEDLRVIPRLNLKSTQRALFYSNWCIREFAETLFVLPHIWRS